MTAETLPFLATSDAVIVHLPTLMPPIPDPPQTRTVAVRTRTVAEVVLG